MGIDPCPPNVLGLSVRETSACLCHHPVRIGLLVRLVIKEVCSLSNELNDEKES